jgi:hypothetical protein
MSRRLLLALLLVLAFVPLAHAARAAMILGDAHRAVQSGGDVSVSDPETGEPIDSDSDGGLSSTGAYGLFDEDEGVGVAVSGAGVNGIASQTSDIAAELVTAELSADLNAGVGGQGASASGASMSQFQLTFELAGSETWRFTTNAFASNSGTAQMALYRGLDAIFEYSSDWGVPVEQELVLGAGAYVLQASAEASGSAVDFGTSDGFSGISFRFEPVPVPEPGPSGLVLGGLLSLVLLARRRE